MSLFLTLQGEHSIYYVIIMIVTNWIGSTISFPIYINKSHVKINTQQKPSYATHIAHINAKSNSAFNIIGLFSIIIIDFIGEQMGKKEAVIS